MKNPFSAPLALIVSTMRIPFMVMPASLPLSRCCTRMMLTLLEERTKELIMLTAMQLTPTSVSRRLWRIISTKYTTIMPVLSMSGANVLTSVPAILALVPWRCRISPDILWAKKSMGRRRSFHMNVMLPMTAIFPWIRSI